MPVRGCGGFVEGMLEGMLERADARRSPPCGRLPGPAGWVVLGRMETYRGCCEGSFWWYDDVLSLKENG